MNSALVAALLCYAAAPAATCDPREHLSPLNEPEWTLVEPGSMAARLRVAPYSTTQQATQITDATIVLTSRPAAADQSVESTNLVANLPSTSTAPDEALQSLPRR